MTYKTIEAEAIEATSRIEEIEKLLRSYSNSSWEIEELKKEKQELENKLEKLGY